MENAAVTMRDLKKQHNQKMQDLLRRKQTHEKRRHNPDGAKSSADYEVEVSAPVSQPAGAEGAQEVRKLKELNTQLIHRLANERSAHLEMSQRAEVMSREN